ncbi:MAG: hypothetical protein HYT94_02675 [Parcubacteria group bacterium]|nr:hypothetical protein [Parcubacteria group bacterium]
MNSKVILLIAVLVVVAGGVLYMQTSIPEPTLAPVIEQPMRENDAAKEAAPVATGKVDDLLASLGGEDSQEADFIKTGDADAEVVLSDESVISDLNQSYDETTL